MTRKKVQLQRVSNDNARKASLKKRKLGLMKKVSELTTLCDVKAFVIIYGPDDKEPSMWPSRPEVEELLLRYVSCPEMERFKKLTNQETYLKEKVAKLADQLKKHRKSNREMKMNRMLRQIHFEGKTFREFEPDDLHELLSFLEEKKVELKRRICTYQVSSASLGQASLATAGETVHAEFIKPRSWDEWFVEMVKETEALPSYSAIIKSNQMGPQYSYSDGATLAPDNFENNNWSDHSIGFHSFPNTAGSSRLNAADGGPKLVLPVAVAIGNGRGYTTGMHAPLASDGVRGGHGMVIPVSSGRPGFSSGGSNLNLLYGTFIDGQGGASSVNFPYDSSLMGGGSNVGVPYDVSWPQGFP